MRFWAWFALNVLQISGDVLPPSLDGLLQWSRLFRNRGTFGNYLSYVKLACEIQGAPVSVFAHPSLARAKESIRKRRLVEPRPLTWIGLRVVQDLMMQLLMRPYLKELLMLFLTAYTFLLRVPSEGLPICAHQAEAGLEAPVLHVRSGEIELWLPRRKNRLYPTRLVRRCWCEQCRLTCPVHVLGAYMASLRPGARPFLHISASQALLALRELLCELNVEHAMSHRLHDFRRGHAEDLRRAGGRLGEILEAGDWSSGAYRDYLDKCRLERDRVAEAHGGCLPSDSESCGSDDEG